MMCLSSSTSSASPLTSSRWISALSTPSALQVSPPSTPPSPLPWLLPPTSLHQWVNPAPLIFHTLKKNQYMYNDQCLAGHLSVSSMAKTAVLAFLFIVVVSHFQTAQPFVLRWILGTLYLLTCQATVTVGDSHLCCCVCVQSYMRSLCCHWHSQGHKVWILYENVCISLNRVWPKLVCLCIIIRWKCCVVSWSCSTVCFSSLFGRERLVFHWQSLCLWVWPDCVTVIDRFSVSGSLVWLCDCVINRFSVFVSLAWLCDCVIDRYSVCESGLIVWLCYWRFSESVSLAWLCDCYWQIQCVCEFGLIVWLAVYMTLAWVCHWQIQHVCEIGLIM